MNWKYVPYAGFFLFSVLLTVIRYIVMPDLSLGIHMLWLAAQFFLLSLVWLIIRTIARALDKRLPYQKSFSKRVFLQVITSLVIIMPPVLLVYNFVKPGLPRFFSSQFVALSCILLFVVVVLMNTGYAAGVFFSNWQWSVKE